MSAQVMDVDSDGFNEHVVERSRHTPVLVDFWAAWCGPCRMLGPVLERLASEPNSPFVLVKIDIDANPDLAAKYAVRSIPAVKLFSDGEVTAEFLGALPEAQVRQFLREHIPSAADIEVATGKSAEAEGNVAQAQAAYQRALGHEPNHGAANLALARIAVTRGESDQATAHLDAIDPRSDEHRAAEQLREAMSFFAACAEAGGQSECRARLEANPNDHDARYALGACLAAAGNHREALEHLLASVEADKTYNGAAARKAMLTIFGLIGIRSPLADEYRDKLAMLL